MGKQIKFVSQSNLLIANTYNTSSLKVVWALLGLSGLIGGAKYHPVVPIIDAWDYTECQREVANIKATFLCLLIPR